MMRVKKVSFRKLREQLNSDWDDIKQQAWQRVLRAKPGFKLSDRTSYQYYNLAVYSAAMDRMRHLDHLPSFTELYVVDQEKASPEMDMSLDLFRAFSRLFTSEVARETAAFLLNQLTWQDLANKYRKSKPTIYRMMKRRVQRLQAALFDYA